jgi:hypothetical protein
LATLGAQEVRQSISAERSGRVRSLLAVEDRVNSGDGFTWLRLIARVMKQFVPYNVAPLSNNRLNTGSGPF